MEQFSGYIIKAFMLQRIWYCYLSYHLVTAYYVTIVRPLEIPTEIVDVLSILVYSIQSNPILTIITCLQLHLCRDENVTSSLRKSPPNITNDYGKCNGVA